MILENTGLNILIIVQIIVDIALICAILLIYKRLQFLDPKKLDKLLALLKTNEAMVKKVTSSINVPKVSIEEDILTLFKAGKSTNDIATLLNITQAEVELTIEKHKLRTNG